MVRLTLAALAVAFLAIAGVVTYRTLNFTASAPPSAVAVPNLNTYPVDMNAAAQHLGAAVRFNTVSLPEAGADTSAAQGPSTEPRSGADISVQIIGSDPHAVAATQRTVHTMLQGAMGGRNSFEHFQQWLQQTYPVFHAAAKREVIGDLNLLYTWQGSDPAQPPLLLLAHQDTVPVPPDTLASWRHNPFGGEIIDGAVWGRGSIDDKGSLISILEAAETLARAGLHPKRTIMIAFGHDEEIGGNEGAVVIARHLHDAGVHAWFAIDEGLAIIARHPLTGHPAALIGISEKGSGTLRVVAHGTPGHSSIPPAETAVSLLADAVTRIHAMPITHSLQGGPALDMMRALSPQLSPLNRAVLANEWLSGPLLQAQFAHNPEAMALMGTTNAPTVISGGSRPNVLPGEATALINLRIHPRDTAADLLTRAKHAVSGMSGVSVEWDAPPLEASPVSSTDSTSYALIAALAHAVYPQAPVAPCLVLGGTDSRYYAGVVENIYRFQAVVFTDADLEGIHGVNEHLSVENLGRMIHFYIGLMQAGAM